MSKKNPPWPFDKKAPSNDDHMLERFLKLQATAPSTEWEKRYNALVGALVGLCEWSESYERNDPNCQIVLAGDIRKIIEDNP